jgi:hypothetical protein
MGKRGVKIRVEFRVMFGVEGNSYPVGNLPRGQFLVGSQRIVPPHADQQPVACHRLNCQIAHLHRERHHRGLEIPIVQRCQQLRGAMGRGPDFTFRK